MICAACRSENDPGAKFCNQCGASLNAGCPNCGATNKPGARFCAECGTQLAAAAATNEAAGVVPAAAPAPAVPSPAAERRLVSILFADLVGFTPFAEERDAEEVRDTLGRYFELASDVVARYGGTVEKFIGDAVMAVWGAPSAHEDDAERAVRAALELVDAVPTLGTGIQARAGVLTGEAAVTLGATNQGMVAGDLVNTASRLQSVAPAGAVLVGETTKRAASRAIAFAPAGEQLLKGKKAPVAAWQALRIIAEVGGRNRSDTLEAPFVGRDEEMRLLKDLFHATAREKRVRLVSVMGPGGIGKSRLAWEFSKYIDGMIEDIWWHAGRSPSYGEGITFWALGEMVRGRCGLSETDDEATTRAKVGEAVGKWVANPAERGWIERALLTLLGVETGMGADQLFGAWRTFFERIAAHGPTVLVFEDMHFADSGLLDFVDHLIDWSRDLPIYVVTLARPDLVERRPGWGAGKRNFVSLYLEPLPEAQMRELLAGLVPGLPDKAARSIVARADGIPLYAVETVRMLVGDGRLVEQDGVYVPQGDLQELSVPETLTALIASRLDALDEADRRLIQDAAVLGQSLSQAALAAVTESSPAELDERLAGLVRREILRRESDPRSPEHGQFAFVQALIREVAYNTLSRRDRKTRHLAAARYFESLASGEIAGALASHYLAAHSNAAEGAEAEALAAQARIALKAAAERAVALGSYEQAVTYSEQALAVTTDDAEQAALLEQAGRAAMAAARNEHAEQLLRSATERWRQAGDRVGLARATNSLARALGILARNDDAVALAKAAVAELSDLAGEPVWAELTLALARALFNSGDRAAALEQYETVLRVAEEHYLPAVIADALTFKGVGLTTMRRVREGIALMEGARALAEDHGLTESVLRATFYSSSSLIEQNVGVGFERLRDGLAMARRYGQRYWAHAFLVNIGYAGLLAGEWDAVLPELDAALAEDLEVSDRLPILNNQLIMRACRGESVTAALAEFERQVTQVDNAWMRIHFLDPAGNAAVAEGRLEAAGAAWRELTELDDSAVAEFRYRAARTALWRRDADMAREDHAAFEAASTPGPTTDARRATLLAGLAALDGRPAEAVSLYRDALRGWREVGSVWDEALTGIDMAELLDPAEPEVAAVVSSTREILERLGARPFIERLDAAAGRPAPQPDPAAEPSVSGAPLPAPPAP